MKIWKNIGMSIKAKSVRYLLPDDPALCAGLRGDPESRPNAGGSPCRTGRGVAAARCQESRVAILFQQPTVAHARQSRAPVKEDILKARDRLRRAIPSCVSSAAIWAATRTICAAGQAPRRLPELRGRHRRPNPLLRRGRPRAGPAIPDAVRGPHPLCHRFLAPRYRTRRCRQVSTGHPRSRLGLFLGRIRWSTTESRRVAWRLPEGILRKLFRENALRWLPEIDV